MISACQSGLIVVVQLPVWWLFFNLSSTAELTHHPLISPHRPFEPHVYLATISWSLFLFATTVEETLTG